MKLITLAFAAALIASACTDDSPLSPDPVLEQQLRDQQNPCQDSARERHCLDDKPPKPPLPG